MQTGDPFKILGLGPQASKEDIRKAYRALVKKYHPDKNPSKAAAAKFIEIQTAYEQINGQTAQLNPFTVEQKYRSTQQKYDQDLEAYKKQSAAAREKLRQQKQREEAYKINYLKNLKSGKIGAWHRSVSLVGALLFVVVWLDFFLATQQTPIISHSYGIHTYSSTNDHTVQLFKSTDQRAFWVSSYPSQQLPKVQQLHAIETPWLHQVKALRFNDGLYQQYIPIHFSFYWAQIWLSLLFLLPIVSWYFASADIIFVAGSFISRYPIALLILWFLLTENRYLHLLSLGQL